MTDSQQPDDFGAKPGVALVTGGTGGLGSAVVRMLAARGSAVAFTYRKNVAEADKLLAEIGGGAAYSLDLTDDAAIADMQAQLLDEFGAVHTVVHAAGPHVPMVHLSQVSPADFRSQLNQDAGALFALLQPLLPALRESKAAIVVISTAATHRYPVRDGLSAVPKGSVDSLVRALAAEEGRFGIRVNAVGRDDHRRHGDPVDGQRRAG